MVVSQLAEYRYREELAVLRRLKQRVLRGEVRAIAICAKGRDNREEVNVLGDYRDDPDDGVRATLKISRRLNALADELDAI